MRLAPDVSGLNHQVMADLALDAEVPVDGVGRPQVGVHPGKCVVEGKLRLVNDRVVAWKRRYRPGA